MSQSQPNFLVICTDQMRADHLGCAGNPVIQTPHLDALAESGSHFQRAYVNCPLCMPSRATMFTGLTPRGHGVRTNGIPLSRELPTLTAALKGAGYHTASIGKLHFSNYWLNDDVKEQVKLEDFLEVRAFWEEGKVSDIPTPYYGFDHVDITLGHGSYTGGHYANWLKEQHPEAWKKLQTEGVNPSPSGAEQSGTFPLDESLHHTAYVANQTIDHLDKLEDDQPFFLFCSFPDPHHPYELPENWEHKYSPDEVVPPIAREGEFDDLAPFFKDIFANDLQLSGRGKATDIPYEHKLELIARTYAMVSLLDKYIGRVIQALDAKGLRDNTVIVFMSDHGDMLGDHGLLNKGPFHFEGLLHIPMIWSWKNHVKKQETRALMSLLDFAPTVLELAGVPVPEGPASAEAPMQPPAWAGRSQVPVLTGSADKVQDAILVENDEDYLGLRLRTLITPRYKLTTYTGHRGLEPYGELFDLEHDPHELHNLWHSADHGSLKAELFEALLSKIIETDSAVPRRLSHA
ncbi:MAG: sulfatase-like hydrolase/transferase [Trueperaceae bacterium]|nr:sulfatase-like hydrolase/transferase [Trueperaceae bacterium]